METPNDDKCLMAVGETYEGAIVLYVGLPINFAELCETKSVKLDTSEIDPELWRSISSVHFMLKEDLEVAMDPQAQGALPK